MKRKLAVQLYSLREFSQQNFLDVLKFVADTGYLAVEPAVGLYGMTPAEFKKVLADLGLEMYSSHYPWCRGVDTMAETIDIAGQLGLKRVVCGYGPKDFEDMDAIKRTADLTNAMIEKAAAAGLKMFQHNHSWEFEKLDGRIKYDIYCELCPKIRLQMDAFWSTNFGANDPVEMMKQFSSRIDLIHMKDGDVKQKESELRMVNGTYDRKVMLHPLGSGDLDIPAVLAAAPVSVDHVIVELDYCSVEMHEALKRSYDYMVSAGVGYGSR